MQTFDCDAILFDLDGVLVDSTRSVDRQWRLWARENNLDPQKIIDVAHGRRTVETVREIMPQIDAEAEAVKLEKREAHDTEGVTVMPGAADLLATIPHGRWCVVTSGTRYLATRRLALGQLPVPDILVTADDVSEGKPHPQPYLKGAHVLGMEPRRCVVIEDAPAGIRAAHAAGMKVIALTSTYKAQELSEADAIVSVLADVKVRVDGSAIQITLARSALTK
jgi:mannitol-1-/sugar-/sorbitol-6-phosphatase